MSKFVFLPPILLVCIVGSISLSAEPPLVDPHRTSPSGISNIGVKECAACHSSPSPLYEDDVPEKGILGVTRFVRLVEAKEWWERDKHSYAYQLVRQDLDPSELDKVERKSNKLSKEITSRLKWTPGDKNFERKCLTCHTGMNPSEHASKLDVGFGVQCESCHGPGSEYTKLEHHQQVSWREKTPEYKSELGMWDLTSPSTTTRVCLSCHLGNIKEERFVTHDMYAAGHPVLPPFDLQVFLNAMPPHWRTLQEKPTFENESDYLGVHFDIQGNSDEIRSAIRGSYEKTKRSMIGGLVANDLGIKLIHQGAAEPKMWGDYSNYSCMGCHQELKKNSSSFQRESRIPGRPFPPNWLSLEYPSVHVSNRDSHESITREFFASFNSVPFGDAQRINQLRERQDQSLEERFQDRRKMEKQIMTKKDVLQWLEFLVQSRKDSLSDFWVARQTSWMVCVAVEELVERGDLAPALVNEAKKELMDLMRLDLKIPQRESVLVSQSDILKTANYFDSVKCRELIAKLVQAATNIPLHLGMHD